MQIVDFTTQHVEQAIRIFKQCYDEERRFVPALPPLDDPPDMTRYVECGLGVAAFGNGSMIGYLCSLPPMDDAFRSTGVRGVFSPMGASAAVGTERSAVYARLYGAAAQKWVSAGAASHAICLFTHDEEAKGQFFRYGFGLRCIDAIRPMDDIPTQPLEEYSFGVLTRDTALDVLPLENMLNSGYLESPFFMHREGPTEKEFMESWDRLHPTYLVARSGEQIVAFMEAEAEGETFISHTPGYLHITGAYCRPEHRGKGLATKLLSLLVRRARDQGCQRLGVDFESLNPSAYGFWLKHFAAYTNSVVRRIDERAMILRDRF